MIQPDGEREDEDADLALRPGELPPKGAAVELSQRGFGWAALSGSWRDRVTGTPELIPGIAAVAVLLFWATAQGGVDVTDSNPAAMFLLGLLLVTGFAFRAHLLRLPRLPLVAISLLAAFTLWNFLSIAWAADQGAAWDGANRCLLYLTIFSVFAIPPWRPGAAAGLLGVYAIAIGAIGAIVLLEAAGSADPLFHFFIAGRYSEPTGYHNANAALFTGGMFIAVFLASRRETPWPLRGVTLAVAGVLFQLALMPQSRGWLIAAPLALVVYFVLVPGLVRSLTVMFPLAIVAAITAPTILDVYDTVNNGAPVGPALDHAKTAMLVAAAVLFVAGAAIGFVDRRVRVPERTSRIGSRMVIGFAGAGALAGVVVALATIGNPVGWAGDRWDEFKGGEFEHSYHQGSRLSQGLGSNRYDFWRVAADDFKAYPLNGVGSDNFAQDYVRDRHSSEEPTYPHNLPLGILSGTGLIGGLLFAGFLVASLVGLGRVRLRAAEPLGRGVAGIVAVCFVYWFVHSIGDWFWAFPALSAPVFALLGMGIRVGADRTAHPQPRWSRKWEVPLIGAATVATFLAALSLALPWIAALDVNKATEIWRADPAEAFDRLDRAHRLNFLSAHPDLVQAAIAAQLGERRRTRASFDRALGRDPGNWYATLELAALDGIEGDRASALRRLQRVAELNPREPTTEIVRRGVESGKPVSLQELFAAFLGRYCERLGRQQTAAGTCGPG